MFKKVLIAAGLAVAGILIVVLVNTFRYKSKQVMVEVTPATVVSPESIQHFQAAIQIPTISYGDSSQIDTTQFLTFRHFLEITYPLTHKNLTRETVARFTLLYRWEGRDPSVKPAIFMAHQDVVPIEDATRGMWTVNPFGGEIKDNFIWGRGTTDNKSNLISIFEAVEKMQKENFQPARTIYLMLGHDEETGGKGAKAVAALLKSRGVTAELVMDEGGIVTTDKIPGMTKPVALLGTSEKGYLSLELVAEKNGGHSSQPETETSIDILMKAIQAIRQNPFETTISESTQGLMDHLGPEMSFAGKMIFANQWLFKSLIIAQYEKSPGGNAMMRTTAVPTIIDAGMKDNVVPTLATATVNFRLLPGDKSSDVIARVKQLINDDRIKMNIANGLVSEASGVASEDGFGYKSVEETVRKTFQNTIAAPFLMIGGTDSRHFEELSQGIIKFSPMVDPIGFHGIDERVSLESYGLSIHFYDQLLRKL